MKVWLIDDELPALKEMAYLLSQYKEVEIIGADTASLEALEKMQQNPSDAVFLDIDMPELNGLETAVRIRDAAPQTLVIFVSAYPQYALEAYATHPEDFLLKPVRQQRLHSCMEHLKKRFPPALHTGKTPLTIRCFGAFHIGAPIEVRWETRRVRELFLYLIDRCGSPASNQELAEVLFGEPSDKKTLHNLCMTLYRLKGLLYQMDPTQTLLRLTEQNALLIAPGVCDFSDFMRFARANAVVCTGNASEAARVLRLCEGPYLDGMGFDWAAESARETEEEYERIALGLSDWYQANAKDEEAGRMLNAMIQRGGFCEEAHVKLMELALAKNDREGFLSCYLQYARTLKRELGQSPSRRLREAYERLK